MTPIPGKSFKVIFPFTTSTPLNRSLEISKLPSRSAKSTNGENCEAAEIAHEVSVIQPTITRIPSACANVTIFHASRIPVHFISLILIPVKASFKAATSPKRCNDSSQCLFLSANESYQARIDGLSSLGWHLSLSADSLPSGWFQSSPYHCPVPALPLIY